MKAICYCTTLECVEKLNGFFDFYLGGFNSLLHDFLKNI